MDSFKNHNRLPFIMRCPLSIGGICKDDWAVCKTGVYQDGGCISECVRTGCFGGLRRLTEMVNGAYV